MIAFSQNTGTRYRHLIWDWNGTLLDDTRLCAAIINEMLRERGHKPWHLDAHRRAFDFPVLRFYERLGFDLEQESFETLSEVFIGRYQQRVGDCPLHKGAIDLLRLVSGTGCSQSILSASRQDHLDRLIALHGLEGYFVAVNGIDTILAPGKTERGRQWIRELDCDPAEVVMVGDTVHDAEVAMAMGCDCLLLASGAHPADKLEATGMPVYPDIEGLRCALMFAVG